jgi:hypothetical protein
MAPAKVTGTVTLDGEPLPNASISFSPESGSGVVSVGGSDASGRYELYYADGKTGAKIGRYKVCATTESPHMGIPESVPKKYLSPDTTDLTVTVNSGKNTINLELKSK